jgi:hypothetical protein
MSPPLVGVSPPLAAFPAVGPSFLAPQGGSVPRGVRLASPVVGGAAPRLHRTQATGRPERLGPRQQLPQPTGWLTRSRRHTQGHVWWHARASLHRISESTVQHIRLLPRRPPLPSSLTCCCTLTVCCCSQAGVQGRVEGGLGRPAPNLSQPPARHGVLPKGSTPWQAGSTCLPALGSSQACMWAAPIRYSRAHWHSHLDGGSSRRGGAACAGNGHSQAAYGNPARSLQYRD